MENTRKVYYTLRLFRDKRKNDELQKLSLSNQDFEYRRLYIEERELDLHVFGSREIVFNWIFMSLMALTVSSYRFPVLALILFVFGVIAKIISLQYRKLWYKVERIYSRVLKIVNSAIYNEYGISFF